MLFRGIIEFILLRIETFFRNLVTLLGGWNAQGLLNDKSSASAVIYQARFSHKSNFVRLGTMCVPIRYFFSYCFLVV